MRCPHCELPNEEGAAFCASCGTPLTFYGSQVTGEVSEATRAKLAKLAIRPPVVPIMAAYCAFIALGGPIWRVASMFFGRTQVNQEGTNYIGAAFGAVGIAMAAMTLIPLGVAMLVVAGGILTQRTWSWGAALVVMAAALITTFTGYFFGVAIFKILVIGGTVALAAMWLRQDVREWFGVG